MSKRVIRKSTRKPEVTRHRPYLVVQRGQARHQAAAQFVWQYRRQLHQLGVVDFDLPWGASLPPWLNVIFASLRLHARHWRVVETVKPGAGGITYRVYWTQWMKNLKGRT